MATSDTDEAFGQLRYVTEGASLFGGNPETGLVALEPEDGGSSPTAYDHVVEATFEEEGFLGRPRGWER